jgi:YD repeat-containing protein
VYSASTGLPVEQKLTCKSSCETFDSQAIVVEYDKLGRSVKSTDADGGTSEVSYDLLGRPAVFYDGKGTQTFGYDATSGLLTKLEDSGAGMFTAAYDADGNLVEEGLPDGLVAKTTYDEASQAVGLSYTKVTSCSEKCTWLEESNERSIYGQILSQTSLGSTQQYTYDRVGRLEIVRDTPKGGGCTTRQYSFEGEAGQDSNRTKLTTRAPGVGGACDTTSAGTVQKYEYDAGDRLVGPESVTYDSFGRITSLPSKVAGGSILATSYYSNSMVATQSQGGLTNSYQLDASGRPRQVTQTGTKTGVEVFHYSTASDSTAWTERGGSWSRNISGISRGLAAIQGSSGTTTLLLANLHGDTVATASLSPTAKEPTAKFEFDEFGNPKTGSAGRYGWLGESQRRTELPSGVIQMGVRSYIPSMGRFISTADPVNQFDLNGEKAKAKMGVGNGRAVSRPGTGGAVSSAPAAAATYSGKKPIKRKFKTRSINRIGCSMGGIGTGTLSSEGWVKMLLDITFSCDVKAVLVGFIVAEHFISPNFFSEYASHGHLYLGLGFLYGEHVQYCISGYNDNEESFKGACGSLYFLIV